MILTRPDPAVARDPFEELADRRNREQRVQSTFDRINAVAGEYHAKKAGREQYEHLLTALGKAKALANRSQEPDPEPTPERPRNPRHRSPRFPG